MARTARAANMGDSHRIVGIVERHFAERGEPHRPQTGVEIGVFRGATSARLLRQFEQLHLVMVDCWCEFPKGHPYRNCGDSAGKQNERQNQDNWLAAVQETLFAFHRRKVIRDFSLNVAAGMAAERFDFCFLDGSHILEDVRADIAAWWPLVSPGGLLAGHDYSHPRNFRPVNGWGVNQAVEEFCERERLVWNVEGSVWFVVKPDGIANEKAA